MGMEPAGGDFVIFRVLEAVRERVWQTLTDLEAMKHWWGPAGFTMIAGKMDLRPGGFFHGGIKSPEGYKIWGKFSYVGDRPAGAAGIHQHVFQRSRRHRPPSDHPDLADRNPGDADARRVARGQDQAERPLDAAQLHRRRTKDFRRRPCRHEGDVERHLRPARGLSRESVLIAAPKGASGKAGHGCDQT